MPRPGDDENARCDPPESDDDRDRRLLGVPRCHKLADTVTKKAPATNNTSAASEVNGLSVRTTPTTAHTTPSNCRAQGRVTG
jgi:hypothetical protein